MSNAMYPGSFDPITKGHLDIILRASKLFDEVVVAILVNSKKSATFSVEERIAMLKNCTKNIDNVKIVSGNELTVNLAKSLNCKVLVRGIRAVADYEYELQQATANMMLNGEIETVFLVSRPEYSFFSSSVAKDIASYNGDISGFIPEEIIEEVKKVLLPKID